ncbi:copper resistance system multicopper oxidase [Parvibaculum sp.]|uniref:copper resistance system multicopper oxidase n=1 Tax=Parvibaculum sp. TaxID=2024848 RepID=UPI002636CB9B|nr:copper resistance system multicopper oxidase [Parvibaculum sp.]MCW5728497.1 copper resistance system multicopper oxidase [Parvibaculum sp.]MDP1626889.1 copper resistance system multicopper oxidase [Parvibaculum sp.]MDP2148535.1 copper resistance system multicopper oxidase [Parvibaculum sp.]MDP3329296.1 copper resistance system multicopper oxidase [Parvibaculum sp.]
MFPKIFTDPARLLRGRTISILGAALLWALPGAGPAVAGEYDLTVETAHVEIGGRMVEKMTINGGVPGPTLRLREGEDATITVTNKTDEATSVHWHGILLPGIMDGAPGFNGFMGIAPGASYTYTFPIRQSGTYWYHSHSGTQDQTVLGAIVIEPAKPTPFSTDRDYVVLLGDATPEDSDRVLRNLKADPGYYNYSKRTLLDFFADVGREGVGATVQDRLDWGAMRMDPTDLADVTGYSFLVNGKAPERNETFLFRKGERIRLRLINGAAMTFFDVRIPGLKMTVVAADGNDVNPVPVDELRIGVAERYDVIVEPKEDMPYTLFAESIDRAGYARATLATSEGEAGPIPERRPRALLSMADMGMAHEGHDMGAMDSGSTDSGTTNAGAMDHSTMDHSAMGHASASNVAETDAPETGPVGWASGFPPDAKVLAYSDLRALRPNVDNSEPTRTIEMRLTGNMERYVWTLDDARLAEARPVRVRYGERVRLTFVNETMMAHPMHLHGMFFELETGSKDRRPLKDTVIVPPGQSVSVVLTAREVGGWPLHCHLLYHMVSGMMTTFIVEPPETADNAITPDGAVVPIGVTKDGTAHGSHAGHGSM